MSLTRQILRLTRRLLILGVLLLCLTFFASQRPVYADACSDCTATYNNHVNFCYGILYLCQQLGGTACESLFETCWSNSTVAYYSCQSNNCVESGGGREPGGGEPPGWRTACVRACDDVYWACHDNGGANTGSYQSCVASGVDADDCCYLERVICLGGC
jgi:hypothetical protein